MEAVFGPSYHDVYQELQILKSNFENERQAYEEKIDALLKAIQHMNTIGESSETSDTQRKPNLSSSTGLRQTESDNGITALLADKEQGIRGLESQISRLRNELAMINIDLTAMSLNPSVADDGLDVSCEAFRDRYKRLLGMIIERDTVIGRLQQKLKTAEQNVDQDLNGWKIEVADLETKLRHKEDELQEQEDKLSRIQLEREAESVQMFGTIGKLQEEINELNSIQYSGDPLNAFRDKYAMLLHRHQQQQSVLLDLQRMTSRIAQLTQKLKQVETRQTATIEQLETEQEARRELEKAFKDTVHALDEARVQSSNRKQLLDAQSAQHHAELTRLTMDLTNRIRQERKRSDVVCADSQSKIEALQVQIEQQRTECFPLLSIAARFETMVNGIRGLHQRLETVTEESRKLEEIRLGLEQGFNSKAADVRRLTVELDGLRQHLQQMGEERQVSDKKYRGLVKELQRELKREQTNSKAGEARISHMQETINQLSTDIKALKEERARASAITDEKGEIEIGPALAEIPIPTRESEEDLDTEMARLIKQFSNVQSDKWMLEERIKFLEETNQDLTLDIEKKDKIIKAWALTNGAASTTNTSDGTLAGFKGLFGGAGNVGEEEKLSATIQDLMLKNTDLQKDLDVMRQEIARLSTPSFS
eukprot:Clim_evm1s221 gene=Clim_evmTU1s221